MDGMRDSTTYLLGRASTRGALETRQFLTRNAVPFQWVDVENDALVQLLQGDAQLTGRRYPRAARLGRAPGSRTTRASRTESMEPSSRRASTPRHPGSAPRS